MAETLRLDRYKASIPSKALYSGSAVEIEVKGKLRKALADFTDKYTAQEVALRVDGKEVARPRMLMRLENGQFQVNSGEPTPEFAEAVKKLLSGRATLELSTE